MRKAVRVGLVGLWLLVASGFVTRLWMTTHYIDSIPDIEGPFRDWLWVEVIVDRNMKSEAELLARFCFSLVAVSLLTLLGWFLWRRIKTR